MRFELIYKKCSKNKAENPIHVGKTFYKKKPYENNLLGTTNDVNVTMEADPELLISKTTSQKDYKQKNDLL